MTKDNAYVVPENNTASATVDSTFPIIAAAETTRTTASSASSTIAHSEYNISSSSSSSSAAIISTGAAPGNHGRSRGYSESSHTTSFGRPDMHRNISNGSSGVGGSQLVPDTPMSSSSNSSPMSDLRRDGKPFVGCSAFEDYELLTKLGQGTFGEVHKAVHKATGSLVALKRVLMHNEKEGLPITAIREIKLLKSLRHPNIVPLSDMLVRHEAQGSTATPSVYMVFPYMDHDLTGLLENPKIQLRLEHIKLYLRQLLEGTAYLHASRVMHRDMKASNLLLNNDGRLYIADFGLARSFNPDEKKDLTKCVVTRWYRPPELLLGERRYTTSIDIWGIGCIFAEMLVGKPVFQGSSDIGQIDRVMRICGSPTSALWPTWRDLPDCKQVEEFGTYPRRVREEFARFGEDAADLLDQLLQLDPRRRPDAATALKHRFFFTAPFPARPEDMPKFEHSHEFDRRLRQQQRAQQGLQAAGHSAQPRQRQGNMSQHSSPGRRESNHYSRRDDNYGYRAPRNDAGWESQGPSSTTAGSGGGYYRSEARRGNHSNSGTASNRGAPSRNHNHNSSVNYHPYSRTGDRANGSYGGGSGGGKGGDGWR